MELTGGVIGAAKGLACTRWPEPVRKELRSTQRGSRRIDGGNPGQYCGESPEGEEGRQEDPKNVKDRAYNRRMPGKGRESS